MNQKFTVEIEGQKAMSEIDIRAALRSSVYIQFNSDKVTVSPAEPSYTEVADWLGNDCVSTKLILDHYKQEGATGEKENQRQGGDN